MMLKPRQLLQNRYYVLGTIRMGGMSGVYLGEDRKDFGNKVAIKVALPANEEKRKAFEREARTLRALNHPSFPKIIDFFNQGQRQYLIMEFIPGTDLDRVRTRRRAVHPLEVIGWVEQVLDVLETLHALEPPIIHRDIKPANLRLTPNGEVNVLDLGLAKGAASQQRSSKPSKSFQAYTRDYAPPEQIDGSGTDCRSDIYSLAATAYHLLANVKPPNAMKRATSIAIGEADPLLLCCEHNREVPVDIAEILHKAMSLNPKLRPQTAAEMRAALRDVRLRTR